MPPQEDIANSSTLRESKGTARGAPKEHLPDSWPCSDPTNRHRGRGSRNTAKYGFLYAARAPCIECIKRYIHQDGIDPQSRSDSCRYSAIDFVEWELQKRQGLGCKAKYEAYITYTFFHIWFTGAQSVLRCNRTVG